MDSTELIRTAFVAITALGGGLGLSKLLSVRSTNKKIMAEGDKTNFEGTAIFTDSVLKMLNNAQSSADKATRQAEAAVTAAQKCKEEVAYLRRWIISQGLTPPVMEEERI